MTTRFLAAAALAAGTVLAAGACSGDNSSPPAPTTAPATTSPSAPGSAGPVPPGSAAPVSGVYAPTINASDFSSTVDNPYFPLRPGMHWDYRSQTQDGLETTVVAVTDRTKTIMGVACVEVRDTVRLDGELIEDTLDWYAQHRDGTVWYFGEDTKEYENGKVVTTKGSWVGGERGALPGIIMPAHPQVGDKYRQEYYKGDAEDMAEVVSLAETAAAPTGSYQGVVKTRETTPLEPDVLEYKYYARGVGVVLTVDAGAGNARDELVRFTGG